MSKEVKHRRGTTVEHATFIGALAEITVDTTTQALHVHNGASPNGFAITPDRKRATHTVDSVDSAITWATDNATTLQSIRTTSYRDEAACLALSIPYPDGGGADYVVKPNTYTPLGGDHVAGTVVLALNLKPINDIRAWGVTGTIAEHAAVASAVDRVATAGVELYGGGIVALLETTLYLGGGFIGRDILLQAVGTYWSDNLADVVNDVTGKPLVVIQGRVSIKGISVDGGLTTINPSSNDEAASGILFADDARGDVTNIDAVHYNGYGLWTRGKVTDSIIDGVHTRQWNWGEDGWFDVSKRTAYGVANSSGDFFISNVVSNYNLSNITILDGAFTTLWTRVHPYNGSDEAATLNNIKVLGGFGQQFDQTYLDNGGIELHTFNHTFTNTRTVLTTNSGNFVAFDLIASSSNEDARGLIIDGVVVSVNNFLIHSVTGAGSWAKYRHRTVNITRLNLDQSEDMIPFDNVRVQQGDFTSIQVNDTNSNSHRTIANRSSQFSASSDLFAGASYHAIDYSNLSSNYPTYRGAKSRSDDMTVQPLLGDTLCEFWGTGSNGIDFGGPATPYSGGAGVIIEASQDWVGSTNNQGTDVVIKNTPTGSATPVDQWRFTSSSIIPTLGSTQNIGSPASMVGTIYVANLMLTSTNVLMSTGTGSPEGVVSANVGSIYTDQTGGAGSTLYIKEANTGNTGWVAK